MNIASFTIGLDGTFSVDDLKHLVNQVENIPTEHIERYDYKAQARRRFKGVISMKVEEIAPIPAPVDPDSGK